MKRFPQRPSDFTDLVSSHLARVLRFIFLLRNMKKAKLTLLTIYSEMERKPEQTVSQTEGDISPEVPLGW